ncbi:DUF2946 domain-containing protein [Paraburkholderia sp. BL10I2N1]|uniref:DUF2946 domain-containing protein n=1 Tax=Paraburkholderia sp. BL10I2N1 TaxID=1938796 RepID=UPI00105F0CFC|nr:DUF2946 domain-containing protein [Paraburkholderia sp. BL10I2N1]TDN63054.1 DUF2946 family protein [Paraburkholderia sp. BL10I2N1]
MLSRHHQKIGALLGMLAILLSVIAPTISQALRSEYTDVAHHSHHAAGIAHVAPAGSAAHHHGSDSSLFCDACPYCGLIAHTPVLTGAVAPFGVSPQPPWFPPTALVAAFRPYTVGTRAQPRAPPVLS